MPEWIPFDSWTGFFQRIQEDHPTTFPIAIPDAAPVPYRPYRMQARCTACGEWFEAVIPVALSVEDRSLDTTREIVNMGMWKFWNAFAYEHRAWCQGGGDDVS